MTAHSTTTIFEDSQEEEEEDATAHVQLGFKVDNAEQERSVTWFSPAFKPQFVPRRTEPKDFKILTKFIKDETKLVFPNVDLGKL